MLRHIIVFCALCCYLITAEAPVQHVKSANVLDTSGQHTSFSFIRPGLTQTSFAFSGPSSHQSFSSSIGNPQLAQKVLPSLAQALAYRNPALGYYSLGHVANGYNGMVPAFAGTTAGPLAYQATSVDPVTTLTYAQQLQQQQQQQPQQTYLHAYQPANPIYQSQLAQLLALRQAQLVQAQQGQLQGAVIQSEQVDEKLRLRQQQQQPQSLLGVAYSSAPSVSHVKVSGNGYKFDF